MTVSQGPFPAASVLAFALGALLCAAPASHAEEAAEAAEKEPVSPVESFEVGLHGSLGREANWQEHDWGPSLSLGLLSGSEASRWRLGYELEYYYDDASSRLSSAESTQQTRVRSHEFRYGKVSLHKLAGFDLRERLRFIPYVAGGVQYVDSREETYTPEDEDTGEPESTTVSKEHYWAPTWAVGVAFSLNRRTTLSVDYEQNTLGGDKRITRLSLELKVSLFGGAED